MIEQRCDLTDRYFLFAFETYYPAGGLDDVVATDNDVSILMALAPRYEADYLRIWDRTTGDTVWEDGTWGNGCGSPWPKATLREDYTGESKQGEAFSVPPDAEPGGYPVPLKGDGK